MKLPNILIPATKSITVTNKFPSGNINEDTITVGSDGINNYISYLFFDISAIPNDTVISNAELVLFKKNNFYNDSKKEISIYTLSEYFSTYTTFQNRPRVNSTIRKSFYPIISNVAVTVNLTQFISLWFRNKLSNCGIALFDKSNGILAEFGSAKCSDTYLVPFLNVSINPISEKKGNHCKEVKYDKDSNCYKDTKCCKEPNYCKQVNYCKEPNCKGKEPSVRQVRVIGTVAEDSQYEAIVNIGVKRSDSGHTDNYYVTDEYNNLLSGTPLKVDKTYNMAIIPKTKPGDVETMDFYGSYKE